MYGKLITIQQGKVLLMPRTSCCAVLKPVEFSSSNKNVLTGTFLQIKITKIDNFVSFLTGGH